MWDVRNRGAVTRNYDASMAVAAQPRDRCLTAMPTRRVGDASTLRPGRAAAHLPEDAIVPMERAVGYHTLPRFPRA